MKFRIFYYILLSVSPLICSIDEKGKDYLWAPRVEQAIQDRLDFDIFYCKKSLQYEEDQKLLKNIDKTEKYILKKMKCLDKVIPGDFAEIITLIVNFKMTAPLDLSYIGSTRSAEERLLKIRAVGFKKGAIDLLERVESARNRSNKSAFTKC